MLTPDRRNVLNRAIRQRLGEPVRKPRKSRKYYTLLSRERGEPASTWAIEFGDYDRSTVAYERDDMKEADANFARKREYRIITTSPEQKAIDAEVAKIRAEAD